MIRPWPLLLGPALVLAACTPPSRSASSPQAAWGGPPPAGAPQGYPPQPPHYPHYPQQGQPPQPAPQPAPPQPAPAPVPFNPLAWFPITLLPFPAPTQPGPAQPPPTAPTTVPTGGAPPGADGWPAAWAALEAQVLVEVNARRQQGATCGGQAFGPAPPLVGNGPLQQAARAHSRDMADRNYFSHDSQDGRTPTDRLRAAGYRGGTFGENIAAGQGTARATVDQWMASPGHCSNIMDPSYRQLGVGYAFNASAAYQHYWTQDFGG